MAATASTGRKPRGPRDPLIIGAIIPFVIGCGLGLLSARAMGWLG